MPFKPVVLWTDALVYLLVAVVLVLVWHIRRNEYLLVPWRRAGHSASGMAALAVLISFVAVGLLDTVHLRPIVEHDNGEARETAYSVDVLSVLDIIANTAPHAGGKNLFGAVCRSPLRSRDGGASGWGTNARVSPLEVRRSASAESGNAAGAGRCLESCGRGGRGDAGVVAVDRLTGCEAGAERNETFMSALVAISRRTTATPWYAICIILALILLLSGAALALCGNYHIRHRQGGAGRFLSVAEKHSHWACDRYAYHINDAAFCVALGHHRRIFPWLGG